MEIIKNFLFSWIAPEIQQGLHKNFSPEVYGESFQGVHRNLTTDGILPQKRKFPQVESFSTRETFPKRGISPQVETLPRRGFSPLPPRGTARGRTRSVRGSGVGLGKEQEMSHIIFSLCGEATLHRRSLLHFLCTARCASLKESLELSSTSSR